MLADVPNFSGRRPFRSPLHMSISAKLRDGLLDIPPVKGLHPQGDESRGSRIWPQFNPWWCVGDGRIMVDARVQLREQNKEVFTRILEYAASWETERVAASSYPAWPYVGAGYGDGPRILIVGKAHEQWPSLSVGSKNRVSAHRDKVGGHSLEDFMSAFKGEKPSAMIDHLSVLNDLFIEEVERGGYSSQFWTFTRRLLSHFGQDLRSFAWTNLFPFCYAKGGPPSDRFKRVQAEFLPFVTQTCETLNPDLVVVFAPDSWQKHVTEALPGAWTKFDSPVEANRKRNVWRKATLENGAFALRSWHPQGAPAGFRSSLIEELQAGLDWTPREPTRS